jgi:hypothetical protein
MGIRVLRLIEVTYPDLDSFDDDRKLWHLPENGVWSARGGHGQKVYRTSTIIAPFQDNDPVCTVCDLDNRNGTHDALQRTGHLSHTFQVE